MRDGRHCREGEGRKVEMAQTRTVIRRDEEELAEDVT
jgi:hypothetical protein